MTQTFIPVIVVGLLSAMLGAVAGALWGLSQHRHIYDWLSASFLNRMQTAMRSLGYSQEDIDRLISHMGQRIMPPATPPPPTPTKDAIHDLAGGC